MPSPESQGLLDIYPREGNKPQIPAGIDPPQRQAAKDALIRYYSQKPAFGGPVSEDTFRTISPFLKSININPAVGKSELQQLFITSEPDPEEKVFLNKTKSMVDMLDGKRSPDKNWKTCPYRPVSAVTETKISIGSDNFTIGGIGSSGAHEFLFMSRQQESALLSEAIFEALVVSGLPVGKLSKDRITNLIEMISETAKRISRGHNDKLDWERYQAERTIVPSLVSIDYDGVRKYILKKTDPYRIYNRNLEANNELFSLTANCADLSRMAISGAKKIAKKLDIQLMPDIEQYVFCPMHKYNRVHADSYLQEGLQLPGDFGRLRCPSHCAETQALIRSSYAALIPVLTGEPVSYLWSMSRHRPQIYDSGIKYHYWDFRYLVPSPDNPGVYLPKRLIIDDVTNPFTLPSHMRSAYALFEILRKKQIDLKPYETIWIELFMGGRIGIGGIPYDHPKDAKLSLITKIPVEDVATLKWDGLKQTQKELLYTSASPCLHCLSVLKYRNVDMLIEEIPWDTLKGDDGLALEALSQLPLRTVVLK